MMYSALKYASFDLFFVCFGFLVSSKPCKFGYFTSFILLCYVVGLLNLEKLNLSFTLVTDVGLKRLSGLSSLKSLNLDTRQITDVGLASLTGKYALEKCSRLFGVHLV